MYIKMIKHPDDASPEKEVEVILLECGSVRWRFSLIGEASAQFAQWNRNIPFVLDNPPDAQVLAFTLIHEQRHELYLVDPANTSVFVMNDTGQTIEALNRVL